MKRGKAAPSPVKRLGRLTGGLSRKHYKLLCKDWPRCLQHRWRQLIGSRRLAPFKLGNGGLNLPGRGKAAGLLGVNWHWVICSDLLHKVRAHQDASFNGGELVHPNLLLLREALGVSAVRLLEYGNRAVRCGPFMPFAPQSGDGCVHGLGIPKLSGFLHLD